MVREQSKLASHSLHRLALFHCTTSVGLMSFWNVKTFHFLLSLVSSIIFFFTHFSSFLSSLDRNEPRKSSRKLI
jgi:hypothetical protein